MLKPVPKLNPSSSALPLVLLLAARLALGLGYSLVVPVWEAYDEDGHFAYARYLAQHGHLLTPGDPEAELVWERFQPPLYYALIAPILSTFDLGDPLKPIKLNPFFVNGDAGVNYALHPAQPAPADAEIARAVHAARLVGVVLTTLSVLFVYQAAGRLWPRQHIAVWAATLLYAFWPQLLFAGSVLSNDWLVAVFSAGIFDVSVLLAAEGFRPGRALALAGLLAAGLLTKINTLALLPVVGLALALGLASVIRRASWKSPRLWLPLAVLAALVAGALAVLGSLQFVTGQVLRAETFRQFVANLPGGQPTGLGPAGLRYALSYGFRTYLASFGWGNLETYPWVYWAWAVGAGAAGLGLLAWLVRRPRGAMPAALFALTALQAASVLLASLFLVIANNNVYLLPGRYLLPSLPAVVCLLVEGWRALADRGWVRLLAWRAAALGLALVALFIPLQSLATAYAQPRPLAGVVPVPIGARFAAPEGGTIEFLGYARPATVVPGGVARVTLCWQAPQPLANDYPVFLDIVGPDGQGYGRLATYPGRGNYPTTLWTPGVPFCDDYSIKVGADFPAPALAYVQVALLTTTEINGPTLPVLDPGGRPSAASSIDVPLVVAEPHLPGALAHTTNFRFSSALALTGYELTHLPEQQAVRVDLRWEALRDLDANYTVFIHLRDAVDHAYAQGDAEPRGGWYPTALWRKGVVVIDSHLIPLPAGPTPPLALVVGVTMSDPPQRLPAFDSSGSELLDDEAVLEQNLVFP